MTENLYPALTGLLFTVAVICAILSPGFIILSFLDPKNSPPPSDMQVCVQAAIIGLLFWAIVLISFRFFAFVGYQVFVAFG